MDRRYNNLQSALRPTAYHAVAATCRPIELVGLAILLIFYIAVYALKNSTFYSLANYVGPITLFTILSYSSYVIVRSNQLTIWAPIFWFRLTSAAFFGLGALVPLIANDATQNYLSGTFHVSHASTLKVNLLYCTGVLCTVFMYNVFTLKSKVRPQKLVEQSRRVASNLIDGKRTLMFALLFLGAGMVIRYFVLIPYVLGLTQAVLPGAIVTLSLVYYVGLYLIVVYTENFNRRLRAAVLILILVDLTVSIATFAKTQLMLLLIFAFFGFLSNGVTLRKIAIGSVCILLAFFTFQPLVIYGRIIVAERSGTLGAAGLGERIGIIKDYLQGARTSDERGIQWGLLRLSYLHTSSYVVQQYDNGRPGSTLEDAAALFVPRVLWPDKPIITRIANDLNYELFGSENSATSAGVVSEGYWNFGWFGVFAFAIVLAFILSVFTRVSMAIMARRDWLYLPVVFIGVQLGLRVDGFFVPDVLGAAWMAAVLGGALWMVQTAWSAGQASYVNMVYGRGRGRR